MNNWDMKSCKNDDIIDIMIINSILYTSLLNHDDKSKINNLSADDVCKQCEKDFLAYRDEYFLKMCDNFGSFKLKIEFISRVEKYNFYGSTKFNYKIFGYGAPSRRLMKAIESKFNSNNGLSLMLTKSGLIIEEQTNKVVVDINRRINLTYKTIQSINTKKNLVILSIKKAAQTLVNHIWVLFDSSNTSELFIREFIEIKIFFYKKYVPREILESYIGKTNLWTIFSYKSSRFLQRSKQLDSINGGKLYRFDLTVTLKQILRKNVNFSDETLLNNVSIEKLQVNNYIKKSNLCQICMEKTIEYAFVPCGHVFCCAACSSVCTQCPLCRSLIDKKLKLFFTYSIH